MTINEQKAAAKQFVQNWIGKGDEKQDTQTFWINLLQSVFGVENIQEFISFEMPVKIDRTSFIDAYIESTGVLIEQKSKDISLDKGSLQSDGSLLTPFQQARRYAASLPHNKNPRWIVVSNFKEFRIHDMNRPNDTPEIVKLEDLPKEFTRLNFLIDTGDENIKKEMEVSLKAGDLVGVIYDALHSKYINPDSEESLKSLNKLCVRLVFCLYAEDAGLFGRKNMFHDYIKTEAAFGPDHVRQSLIDLFNVLNQKPEDRDPYMSEKLAEFPYVNGGLFADSNIEIPRFDDNLVNLLLGNASENFDWSEISPTIFGAVFESTLNPETRRSGGMHYTSVENIHKVIDPLFLDDLKAEFEEIKNDAIVKTRTNKLKAFQNKLASLTFLDPACGSGNFLTETYLSLRRLENDVIDSLLTYRNEVTSENELQMELRYGASNPIKVSINQLYGIEINDFAVTVAQTALWISEAQMMQETERIIKSELNFLPLKTYTNIIEGNALRIDWNDVVPKEKLDYIMGNPPFVGTKLMSKDQKQDVDNVWGKVTNHGVLDYVACWYKKASDHIKATPIKCALVSTNSIAQGEQVNVLWKYLYEQNVSIDFAYRTFRWDSEASIKAHVHCVIIGFSCIGNDTPKMLFDNARVSPVENINGYLLPAPNVLIDNRKNPISASEFMHNGCKFLDDGNYVFSEEEMQNFIERDSNSQKFFHEYYGAQNYISGEKLYCIWLKNANPSDVKSSPLVIDRIKKVKAFRENCKSPDTQKYADRPMLPTRMAYYSDNEYTDVLLVPIVSSERRKYVPIGYVDKDIIVSYSCMVIPNASLYSFGIITSNVHMAWMRTVCGRLKSDYRYSNTIVYNNFPWPNPTAEQKVKIEKTAQAILDARALYPDSSLADLYDEVTMPPELRKAHQANDRAVMEAYGFWGKLNTESECVAELMKMYQELVNKLN